MQEHGLDPKALPGDDNHVEHTHVAVAAGIASGLAGVGRRIEAAGLEFGLHFVPLIEEDDFLACLKEQLASPAVQRLREVLAAPAWRDVLTRLPGYGPAAAPGQAGDDGRAALVALPPRQGAVARKDRLDHRADGRLSTAHP